MVLSGVLEMGSFGGMNRIFYINTFSKVGLIVSAIFIVSSCASTYQSTIVGGDYDKNKNVTSYFVLPLGSVELPGEWVKKNYLESSHQQYFLNKDSTLISIAFLNADRFSFYKPELKGFDLIETYFNWESEYFKEAYKYEIEKLEENKEKQYIIWRVFGDNSDNIFFFGNKNEIVNSYSIQVTKMSKTESVDFVKKLFVKE